MNILVTGATGFVGQTLLKKLFDDDYFKNCNIYAFLLPNDKFKKDIEKYYQYKNFHIINGNITNFHEIDDAINGKDIVIHVAGLISYWKKDYEKLISINVKGTENVVNSCIKNKIKKLIYISSVGAIGFKKDGTLADENTEYNYPDNLYYMKSKYLAQKIVENAIIEKYLNAIILCPASIMGPGDPDINTAHNQLYKKTYNGKMFGCFTGGLAIVDVRDVCNIIIKNIKNNYEPGKYLLISKNLKYYEVIKTIEKYSHKKTYPFPINPIILSLAGFILELISYITNKKPLLTYGYGILSGWEAYYSNEKSIKTFDYQYIDFEKTIEDSCRYFEEKFLNKIKN